MNILKGRAAVCQEIMCKIFFKHNHHYYFQVQQQLFITKADCSVTLLFVPFPKMVQPCMFMSRSILTQNAGIRNYQSLKDKSGVGMIVDKIKEYTVVNGV